MKICIIEGCNRPCYARNWCEPHYARWRRNADPLGFKRPSWIERFLEKIEITESCWNWRAGIGQKGYGWFRISHRIRERQAHRIAYELFVGPIPDELQIDHLCRNRRCVNPDHLEPVTQRVNTLRGITLASANVAKTHCPAGHSYSGANLVVYGNKRYCRACQKNRNDKKVKEDN